MAVSIHLERRLNPPLGMRIAVPVAAVVAGLVAGGVILALGGHDPIDAYNSMWEGSLGSSDGIEATLIKACPLVRTGLAVATALRIGLWNIGGEGQLIIGATAATGVGLYATSLPGPLVLPAMIFAGCLAGAMWATIAAIPRALIGLNEIIVTLFLNYIAILLMDHLIFGPWADPKAFGFAYSRSLPDAAVLPVIPGSYALQTTGVAQPIATIIEALIIVFLLAGDAALAFRVHMTRPPHALEPATAGVRS